MVILNAEDIEKAIGKFDFITLVWCFFLFLLTLLTVHTVSPLRPKLQSYADGLVIDPLTQGMEGECLTQIFLNFQCQF